MQATYIMSNHPATENTMSDTTKPHYQYMRNLTTGALDVVQNLMTGAFVPLDVPGFLLDEYQRYVDAAGKVLDAQGDSNKEQLTYAKTRKLAEAGQAAQFFIDNATQDAAPRIERDTYPLQAAEAESWALDKTSPTPLLEGIATARNIDLDELRQRTLDKSRAWQSLCANIIGQRQAFEEQIKAAQHLEELAAIQIIYSI